MKTIKEHLMSARNNGVLNPKMHLSGFLFKLAKDSSRNPGAVYVTDRLSGLYLGKVIDSTFHISFAVHGDVAAKVQKIVSDPIEAATVHGQRTGMCCICGRTLFNGASIAAMIGPICAEKYGFDIPQKDNTL